MEITAVLIFIGFGMLFMAPFAIAVFFVIRNHLGQTDAIKAFANSRDFSFMSGNTFGQTIDKHGMLFQLGSGRYIRNSAGGKAGNFNAWLYQYVFSTGSGKNRHTHNHTVCEIKIGNRLPHVIIDSRETGRGVNAYVSQTLQKSNIVNVASGFEKDFTFYAQTGLEQEALEIFTPDILEKIKTYSRSFDIELIGDTMYLYSNKVSADVEFYNYMFDTGAYLAGQLKAELKDFKMPEVLTKPGANFTDVRQITRMTEKQKTIAVASLVVFFMLYIILEVFLAD